MSESNASRSHLAVSIIIPIVTACIGAWAVLKAARSGAIEPKLDVIENSKPYKNLFESYKALSEERERGIAELEMEIQRLRAELVRAQETRNETEPHVPASDTGPKKAPDAEPLKPSIEREPDSQHATSRGVEPGERVQATAQLAKSVVFDGSVRVGVHTYKANWWPQANLTIDGKFVGWQSPGFKRLAKTTQTKRCFVEYAEAPDQNAAVSQATFRFEYSCEPA